MKIVLNENVSSSSGISPRSEGAAFDAVLGHFRYARFSADVIKFMSRARSLYEIESAFYIFSTRGFVDLSPLHGMLQCSRSSFVVQISDIILSSAVLLTFMSGGA